MKPPPSREAPAGARPWLALDVLLPGAAAWALTVLAPARAQVAEPGALAAALVALAALAAGAFVAARSPRAGRALGVHAMLAASLASWWLARRALAPIRLDAVQGALGAVAWALFAMGWGAVERRDGREPGEARAPATPLEPRARLPRGTSAIVGAAAAGAVALELQAFRVAEPERAMLAHALALAASAALLAASASVALRRGRASAAPAPPRVRLARASAALGLLGLVVVVALSLAFFR